MLMTILAEKDTSQNIYKYQNEKCASLGALTDDGIHFFKFQAKIMQSFS